MSDDPREDVRQQDSLLELKGALASDLKDDT
jgi:hypothetical protein